MNIAPFIRPLSALLVCVAVFAPRSAHAEDSVAQESMPRPTERRWVPAVVGVSTFAVSYLPAATVGAVSFNQALDDSVRNPDWQLVRLCGGVFDKCPPEHHHEASLLLVPVIGPLVYARSGERDDEFRKQGPPSTTERVLLYADSIAQAGGLAVATLGVAHLIAPTGARAARSDIAKAADWRVVPTATPQGSSVSVIGTF